MKIIFATKNQGKLKEIKEILHGLPYQVLSMEEAGLHFEIEENGETFEANAEKKAVEVMKASGLPSLADDSGLEIDWLDKGPGVQSARFLGYDTPYHIKNKKILEMMQDLPVQKRTARFVSVIALAMPSGICKHTRATIEGRIHSCSKGENGFGYDPIFFVPEYEMTMAEMPLEMKNAISHRGKALRKMKEILIQMAKEQSDENPGCQ